jgi:hypothetical protein
MTDHTEWRPVPGYEGYYEVSNFGQLRRIMETASGTYTRELKPWKNWQGYVRFAMSVGGVKKTFQAHRLVCLAWHGQPEDGQEVCHNNGVKDDNRPENLRWGTPSENQLDIVRHGNNPQANKTHCPQGHEYSPENTKYVRGTHRRCVECHNAFRRAKAAAQTSATAHTI